MADGASYDPWPLRSAAQINMTVSFPFPFLRPFPLPLLKSSIFVSFARLPSRSAPKTPAQAVRTWEEGARAEGAEPGAGRDPLGGRAPSQKDLLHPVGLQATLDFRLPLLLYFFYSTVMRLFSTFFSIFGRVPVKVSLPVQRPGPFPSKQVSNDADLSFTSLGRKSSRKK